MARDVEIYGKIKNTGIFVFKSYITKVPLMSSLLIHISHFNMYTYNCLCLNKI